MYDTEDLLMLSGIAPGIGDVGPETGLPQELTITPRDPQTGVWTAISEGGSTPSGWPAAVSVRPDNWDMSLQPATYRIASGDTLSGLAATYLGAPNRVMEIWSLQPADFRFSHSMDKITPGMIFNMPDEARDNLKAWLALGQPSNKKPGGLSKADKKTAAIKSYLPYIVGGAVGLGLLYAFSR